MELQGCAQLVSNPIGMAICTLSKPMQYCTIWGQISQLPWLTTAPFFGWVREPEKIIIVSSLPERSFVQRRLWTERAGAPQVWDEGTSWHTDGLRTLLSFPTAAAPSALALTYTEQVIKYQTALEWQLTADPLLHSPLPHSIPNFKSLLS